MIKRFVIRVHGTKTEYYNEHEALFVELICPGTGVTNTNSNDKDTIEAIIKCFNKGLNYDNLRTVFDHPLIQHIYFISEKATCQFSFQNNVEVSEWGKTELELDAGKYNDL